MHDTDQKLIWEAYGDRQHPLGLQSGQLIGDDGVNAQARMILQKFEPLRDIMPADMIANQIQDIRNDIQAIIDGGDRGREMVEYYQGWGIDDLVQLGFILKNAQKDYETPEDSAGDQGQDGIKIREVPPFLGM